MRFSAEEFEVFAAGGVLQFFNVCIIANGFMKLAKYKNPSKKIIIVMKERKNL